MQVTDLTVTPQDAAATGPGTWWDVSFVLRNNGPPSVARDVEFRTNVDVDAGVDLSALPDGCTLTQGELICLIDGRDLDPEGEVTITFAILLTGYVAPGEHIADAHVSSATTDSNPREQRRGDDLRGGGDRGHRPAVAEDGGRHHPEPERRRT